VATGIAVGCGVDPEKFDRLDIESGLLASLTETGVDAHFADFYETAGERPAPGVGARALRISTTPLKGR